MLIFLEEDENMTVSTVNSHIFGIHHVRICLFLFFNQFFAEYITCLCFKKQQHHGNYNNGQLLMEFDNSLLDRHE